jgi:putative PIN family toxin of toxin-antitoxin system
MKLAVVDSGVFAAGVFWRHEAHRCLKAWMLGIITPVMTEDMLDEYEVVLERVKQAHHFRTDTDRWLDALRESAMWVDGEVIGKRLCRDWRDERFIEAAVAAKCQTIIACNPELTDLDKPLGIDICIPREWLDTLTRSQRRRLSHKLPRQ